MVVISIMQIKALPFIAAMWGYYCDCDFRVSFGFHWYGQHTNKHSDKSCPAYTNQI